MGSRPLYIMISRTDTRVGKFIRIFSQYPYNHVSLTLDSSFQCWYSFARYVQDAPFYGGFLRETPERFLAGTGHAQVRIFRLELPENQAKLLTRLFDQAGLSGPYIYNYYDALLRSFGLPVDIPQAHTCLSFACSILNVQLPSIEALNAYLQPHLIFEGDLAQLIPDSGIREDVYFSSLGLAHGTAASASLLGRLTCRMVRHTLRSYLDIQSRRRAH